MSDSKSPHDRIAQHLKAIPKSGIRDFFELVISTQGVISLGVGEPDFDTPWHIREHAMFALEKGATSYTSNLGLLKLRQAISRYVHETFHVEYDPGSEIIISVGVSEAFDLAVRALIDPGDEVLYHEPSYVSYVPLVALAHGKPVSIRTTQKNKFGLTRQEVEEKITKRTKILVLNYPNNPTGATLPFQDLTEIAACVRDHDLIVITDDIYAELTYEGRHVSIASLPGMKERTILLHGFSKAWAMTGFRLGYACAPPALTEAMMKIHQYSMLCAPILSQEAALEALKKPEDDIREMREAYKRHRSYICNAFNHIGIPCAKPTGAFYVFPCIAESGLSSTAFALKLLQEEKVAVVPGSAFGVSGEGFLRCSYAISLDEIKKAMERIDRFWRRLVQSEYKRCVSTSA